MRTLPLSDAINIVKKYGIKFAPSYTAKNFKEIEKVCKKTGFPIAMKIVSKKITHKSDIGGVKTNIHSIADAKKAFAEMKKLAGFEYSIVQPMVSGTEIIIGGKRDVQFGPTILLGLGGIYVEVFKDYSIGICPVSKKTAKQMIDNLKSAPILKGIRGQKGANIKKIIEVIVKTSHLMTKEKQILELDINPLIATQKEIIAVDARVVME